MATYGQYCPLAYALEVLGDRWTLLIIRDLMKGIRHFNDLERGLPGISRGLLAKRLRHLEQAGILEKRMSAGRNTTAYYLTESGHALEATIEALWAWGKAWVFVEPSPEQLNSPLLMWRMHKEVKADHLPQERVVVQFDFYGAERSSYWLILKRDEISLCLTDPGFEVGVVVMADLSAFFQVWAERISYQQALADRKIRVDGLPHLLRAFPKWFTWAAPNVEVR